VIPAPPPERSISVDDVLAIHYLLLADDYPRLEDRLVWSLDSARLDTGYELRYRAAFGAFVSADPSRRPHLDAWVANQPRSAVARLARAAHLLASGDQARGEKFIDETSEQQIREMREWYKLAATDISAARSLDSTNLIAHWLAIQMAMHGSSSDVPRAILDDGLRMVPGSLLLRWRYAFALRPRWGGSMDEMLDFADESDSASTVNPRLRLLRGMVPYDSAIVLLHDDRDEEAIAMFTKALSYGDFFLYREDRGALYRSMKRYEEAIVDFESALAQVPALSGARTKRAASLYWLSRQRTGPEAEELLRRAKRDACIAAELDATDENVTRLVDKIPALRPASMGGAPPLSPLTVGNSLLMGRC